MKLQSKELPPDETDLTQDACQVLRLLLTGRDPVQGAPLPKGSCFVSGRVWRALFVALLHLGKERKKHARKRGINLGMPTGGRAKPAFLETRRTSRLVSFEVPTRRAACSRLVE